MTKDIQQEIGIHFSQVWNICVKEVPSREELRDAAYKYVLENHTDWTIDDFEYFLRVLETRITVFVPAVTKEEAAEDFINDRKEAEGRFNAR